MILLALIVAAQPIALKASRMFDSRKGAIVQPGLVVTENDRIIQVGGTPPAGAQIVDLGDATLLPGLMDAHTHVTSESSGSYYRDLMDFILRPPAEQAQYAAEYARRTLLAGFTAIRDLGAFDRVDFGLHEAIESGAVTGPRLIFAEWPIGARGGHADADPFPPDRLPPLSVEQGICTGADECRAAVRWQIKYGASVIKFMASGGVLSLSDPVDNPQLTQAEMDAIVQEAHAWGRKAAAHCHGDAAAKLAIKAGVDSIEHGTFLKPDTLAEMKKRGTFLMPGPVEKAGPPPEEWLAKQPAAIAEKARRSAAAKPQMIHDAVKAGVRIAYGTDAGVGLHGHNAEQLARLVALGMTPAAVLQAATITDADLLGIEAGVLEKGKLADVIAVPGNPLDDITVTEKVQFVMKGGQIVPRPAPAPKKLALKAARLFDAEKGVLLTPGLVIIEGEKITAIGGAIPPDAEVIDAGDATLMPGLIDAHVHITGESQDDFAKALIERYMKPPAEETLQARVYARRTLEGGITTIRNLGAGDLTDFGLKRAIELGFTEGPRMLVSENPIGSRGGHADGAPDFHMQARGVRQGICAGADQCRDAVRWQLKNGADVIKFMVSGGVLSLTDPVDVPQLTPDETAAIVDEAHLWKKKTAAHCHGDAAAKIAIAAGVDSIEHGSFLQPDTLAEMKRKGVVYIPTLMAVEDVERRANEKKLPPVIAQKALAAASSLAKTVQAAAKLGVVIGLGTDSGVSHHGKNAHEVTLLVKNGLTAVQALQAGTIVDAKLLQMETSIGKLAPGYFADVIAVPGDVLQNPSAVEQVSLVVKGGRVIRR